MAQKTEKTNQSILWPRSPGQLWSEDGGWSRLIPGVLSLDVTRAVAAYGKRRKRRLVGQGVKFSSGHILEVYGLWGCLSGAGEDNSLRREMESFCLEQFSVREGEGM